MVLISSAQRETTPDELERTPVERPPAVPAQRPSRAVDPEILKLRDELDSYYTRIVVLHEEPLDEALRVLSSISARVTQIRSEIMRAGDHRQLQHLRTGELDPLLQQIDRQFKFVSRLISMSELDWNMARGQ